VTGARLRLGKDEMAVQRIGPPVRTVTPQPDPDPARTAKIEAALKAFAQGGRAVQEAPLVAPQARQDYARGPDFSLAGVQSIAYIATLEVSAQGIARHGARAARVLYYRLRADRPTDRETRFVLVYLTSDGLVTDQDVVQE